MSLETHRHTQTCVSWVVPNPVKSVMKTDSHTLKFTFTVMSALLWACTKRSPLLNKHTCLGSCPNTMVWRQPVCSRLAVNWSWAWVEPVCWVMPWQTSVPTPVGQSMLCGWELSCSSQAQQWGIQRESEWLGNQVDIFPSYSRMPVTWSVRAPPTPRWTFWGRIRGTQDGEGAAGARVSLSWDQAQ